jgi:para-nitrobenzyl esterase
VRGISEAGVYAFKGLRYAAPPTGANRFKPPQPVGPWKNIMDADRVGAAAIQPMTGQPDMPPDEQHSEDCLFLNVWTPAPNGPKKPVMVWLHGGGFTSGSGGRPTYSGRFFAQDDIVCVTVNHRLSVFGYLQLPSEWGDEYHASGLAGMLDIVAALRWVKANIAQFGGDPGNVTIFGESGGGAKVSTVLGMPSAKGLFHKAVIQSGAGLEALPRADAEALGAALLDVLGIKAGDKAGLAALDTATIFDAQAKAIAKLTHQDQAPNFIKSTKFLKQGFVPCINSVELPQHPFSPTATRLSQDVPLLIGTNKDESTLFLVHAKGFGSQTDADFEREVRDAYPVIADKVIAELRKAHPDYSPAYLITALSTANMFWKDSVTLAERKVDLNAAPVYMYKMTWETPISGGALKSPHALELSFVFGTYDDVRSFVGPGPAPAIMSKQMHPAWVAFARTGNPNTSALPQWPTYDRTRRATMIFDVESRVVDDPDGALRQLLSLA